MSRNAFVYVWSSEICLYTNPPVSIIGEVLQNITMDKSRVMLVTLLGECCLQLRMERQIVSIRFR